MNSHRSLRVRSKTVKGRPTVVEKPGVGVHAENGSYRIVLDFDGALFSLTVEQLVDIGHLAYVALQKAEPEGRALPVVPFVA